MNVYDAAMHYLQRGWSVLPVKGKQPAGRIKWTQFQERRPTKQQIKSWHNIGMLTGVGIICGKVSNNLIVIDLDGDEAVQTFTATFPNIVNKTKTVHSGSGHGMHIYLEVEQIPHNVRIKGYEVRAEGCYVVAPPSPHPDTGNPYTLANLKGVAYAHNIWNVVQWIEDRKRKSVVQTVNQQRTGQALGYGGAALSGEIAKIRASREGERNNQLYRSALKLGSLVGGGQLVRRQVEDDLLSAALAVDLQYPESVRTIHSGIERGLRNPRHPQQRRLV